MDNEELLPDDFPPQLREIPQPPERLWLRGSMPAPGTKFLAVVGSHALTRYGREACAYLIEGLRGYPVAIVSGLSLGAGMIAHEAALRAGLHTIAVVRAELADDAIEPRSNVPLATRILESGGALLSEHRQERDRLIVGLAHAVLVIEAGERSGTLVAARLACDYNRELLCVPHRINDPHAAANRFLRVGAASVTEPAHVLEALGIEPRPVAEIPLRLSPNEQELYELLETPLSRDILIRTSSLPPHETIMVLGILELKGVLKEEFGLWRRTRA